MTMFWPTTTVSILRGTTTNDAGDVLDSNTAVYTGILASVMERSRTGIDTLTQDPRVYHYTTVRLPAGTDILDTDRLLDEKTGLIYTIADVARLASPVHTPDIRVDVNRVN